MTRIPAAGIVGLVALREAATTDLNQIVTLVRAAVQAALDAAKKPGETYVYFDTDAIYADSVVICKDGKHWKYPYTIDAGNKVTLGDPAEVTEQFVPVSMREALASDGFTFTEAAGTEGKAWDVILVRAGVSKNGVYYPDAVLREAVKLFEGARCYVKSDEEHQNKNSKNAEKIFGWFSEVKFVEGASADTGYLAARLNVAAGMAALRETIVDAWKRGKKDLVGLSINAYGKVKKAVQAGVKQIAESITKVTSVDLIVEPSAGGALVRLVEAADTKEPDPMKEKMFAAIKAKFPQLDVATLTDDQVFARYTEAITPAPRGDAAAGEPFTRKEFDEYQRLVEARDAARVKINATTLPKPSKDALIARFEKLARFTEADVDTEIKAERDYAVRLIEAAGGDAGKVKLGAAGDIEVGDRSKQVADMLDAFFDPKHKNHSSMHSFKECYGEITGDWKVTGRTENVNRSRLAESVGAAFRESLDTTAFANVLGSSLNRRLVADYADKGQYDIWRQAAEVVPVSDFRSQERVRFGGYGDLSIVAESGPYLGMASPADEKATYAPAKRGGTEDVTLEMIKNDDVGSIRRIPVKMSRSAKRTLAKFVLDFVRTNPNIYDGVAFFAVAHNNLGAAALDATSLRAGRLAMLQQTEQGSNDRLGIGPKYIWGATDLETAMADLFKRGTNLDKTFIQDLNLQVMPVWYWTDANDWALSADINDIPGIEVGFLDGQEEPQLFVQDMPNVGSMFSNDKLTYKIRHIYGGAPKEFRGWFKAVVA